MIRANYYIQSLLIGLALALLLLIPLDIGAGIFLLYLQIIVGFIQYGMSLVFIFIPKMRTMTGIVHLIISTIYLLVIGIVQPNSFVPVFVAPWLLALLFWYNARMVLKTSA